MKSTNHFLVFCLLRHGHPCLASDSLEVPILLPQPPSEPMTFQRERNEAQRGEENCPRSHSRLRGKNTRLLGSCPLADFGSHSGLRESTLGESHPWSKVPGSDSWLPSSVPRDREIGAGVPGRVTRGRSREVSREGRERKDLVRVPALRDSDRPRNSG